MPYTTPPTFVPGPLASDDLNILGDDIEYLKAITDGVSFSGVQVRRSSNQSIADDTDTFISFTVEEYDYGGWWSSGTIINVPSGAIPAGFTSIACFVTGFVRFESDSAGKRRMQFTLDGTPFASIKIPALDDDDTTLWLSDFVVAEAANDIKLRVWQNSGGALNVAEAKLTVVRFAPVA